MRVRVIPDLGSTEHISEAKMKFRNKIVTIGRVKDSITKPIVLKELPGWVWKLEHLMRLQDEEMQKLKEKMLG